MVDFSRALSVSPVQKPNTKNVWGAGYSSISEPTIPERTKISNTGTEQYNAFIGELNDEIATYGAKADQMFANALNEADGDYDLAIKTMQEAYGVSEEAFGIAEGNFDLSKDWLDDLDGKYGDLIKMTIAQAKAGVVDESDRSGVRMNEAEASYADEYASQRDALQREAQRYGQNITSSGNASANRVLSAHEANARAGGRQIAYNEEQQRVDNAKKYNFEARAGLTQLGEGLTSDAQGRVSRAGSEMTGVKLKQSDIKSSEASLTAGRGSTKAGLMVDIGDRYASRASDAGRMLMSYTEANKQPVYTKSVTGRPFKKDGTGIFANT